MSDNRIRVTVSSVLKDIVPKYLESLKQEFPKIEQAIEKNDFAYIQGRGHAIKGHAGMYGFAELSTLAHEIEEAARAKDAAQIAKLSAQCADYLNTVEIKFDDQN